VCCQCELSAKPSAAETARLRSKATSYAPSSDRCLEGVGGESIALAEAANMCETPSMGCRRGGAAVGATPSRRRPSQVAAREASPPEATPEPVISDMPAVSSNVQALMRDVKTADDAAAGFPCEFCFVGASKAASQRVAAIDAEFAEKLCEAPRGVDVAAVRAQLERAAGVAITCRKGKKPEQPNQDSFFFCQTQRFRVACVADGHGEFGHWASHWAVRAALRLLLAELATAEALPDDVAMARIFDTTHQAIMYQADIDGFDLSLSGTTFTVAVVDRKSSRALLAWCGDSRCAVGRIGPKGPESVMGTVDHKPQDPEERRRIVGSGGEVVRMFSGMPHRVFARGHEIPGLAMSRALGDLIAHSVGVVHVPGFRRCLLASEDVLLVCSDGVWEFIKNAEACRIVISFGRARAGDAANALAREARDRWLKEEVTITDDITVIVIWM